VVQRGEEARKEEARKEEEESYSVTKISICPMTRGNSMIPGARDFPLSVEMTASFVIPNECEEFRFILRIS